MYNWATENKDNQKITTILLSDENIVSDNEVIIENQKINSVKINFDELLRKNSQTVAWLKVNNTDVNYPVVQYTDNSFYLTHNFENKQNSAGWIFLDYRNQIENLNQNTIIYGHNRRNNSMFATLKNALNTSWCENSENQYITFNTKYANYTAKIFSVYTINANTLSIPTTFETEEEYKNYLNDALNKSFYNFKTQVYTNNKILTLCTCHDNTANRIIIHAKIL